MKLKITRNQRENRGLMGGYKGMVFQLSCKVELSPEEQQLVTKYKLEQHPLTYQEINGERHTAMTVSGLLSGSSEEMKDVATLLSNEAVVKAACSEFRTLLRVMATFGGEEIIDFDAEEAAREAIA